MFRFINSGIKQSITTFPNSVYHCSNLHKIGTEDDNDNKKLLFNSPSKFDETIGYYKSFSQPNKFNFDKRNLVLELSSDFDLIKSIKNQQINIHLNEFLQNFGFYRHKDYNSLATVKDKNIKNDLEIEKYARLNNIGISHISNDNTSKCEIICEKEIKTASNDHNSHKSKKQSDDKISTAKNKTRKLISENKIENLNLLGHELNTKGCEAAKSLDHKTACQYWNCAASFNYPPSQFNLGVYYQSGKDLERAERYYRLAVQCGDHPIAAYNLALLLNNKRDEQLKDEIKDLLTLSANQGSKEAQSCIECINNSI